MSKKYLFIIVSLFVLFSCEKEPDSKGHSLSVLLDYSNATVNIDKEGTKVVLINQTKGYSITIYSDENGEVFFPELESGFYNLSAVKTHKAFGKEYNYNGTLEIELLESKNDTLKLIESQTNALVIKEFYYSGCLTEAGNSYSSDQYIEIYNNSDTTLYADGLSILEHESYAHEPTYWKHIIDSIVVKMIWTIPGTGKDVPIHAGKSIVIARDGIDHKSDPNGNPLSPVNLGNADFEFFVKHDEDKDIDVPFVPNMEEDLLVFRGNDIVFHTRGGSAIALAKIPGNNQQERIEYIQNMYTPKETASGSGYQYFVKISNDFIIDAVEVTWDEMHAIYKRLPIEMDAGYTYVASGTKSGKCIRRKIKEIINGRVVYQDTNNSTEDFLKDAEPKPFIYAE